MQLLLRWKYWIITGLILGLLGVTFLIILYTNPLLRMNILRSEYVQFLLPTFRSLRKVADLPYLPYQVAKASDLPVYDITVDVADIARMNAALPDDFIKGRLTDEYKLKVRAGFTTSEGYRDRVDIRYRGRGPNHWNAYKKSFHVDFPLDNPLNGITELKLFIPEDRQYIVEALNMYRAEKLGTLAPQPFYVRMRINGDDMGVYFAIPHWSKAFPDRNGKGEFANIFGIVDLQLDELEGKNFFDPAEIGYWEDYTGNAELSPGDMDQLKEFLTTVHHASDELYWHALPALVDMDALYDWLIIQTLAASAHQNATVNIILLRDPATGRFQPIPWDAQLYEYHPVSLASHPLIGRTLNNPIFRQEFMNRLRAYVSDSKNLDDDLAFYDKTREQIETALFQDIAKLPLNFQVTRDLDQDRNLIQENFVRVQQLFNEGRENEAWEGVYEKHDPKTTPELSSYLKSVTADPRTFLKEHPQFHPIGANTESLTLGPGRVIISKTVIMPVGISLFIQPGTALLMGEGTSIIVHDRVEARGTAKSPIILRGLTSRPWGSLFIMNRIEREESIFNYVTMSGGSGFRGNGIIATGMLALHSAGGRITNSTFENTFGDDAINIKFGKAYISGNRFRNTFGDAIDLDQIPGEAEVSNNTFGDFGFVADKGAGPNGDGIDLSFTRANIFGNIIQHCGDKGISIGEASAPHVHNNLVFECKIGMSVKDLSDAKLENNYLVGNEIGLEAKRKKEIFGGGIAHLKNSILWGNKTETSVDEFSRFLDEGGNTLESRRDAKPSLQVVPEKFRTILKNIFN